MNINNLLAAFVKKINPNLFEKLENRLKVPFFSKLEAVATLRVATLTDSESCYYIGFLTNALRRKHRWVDADWGLKFGLAILGKSRLELVGATDAYSVADDRAAEVKCRLFSDLLTALGDVPSQGTLLSIRQMRLLDKVVQPETDSFAHLAAALEAQMKRK